MPVANDLGLFLYFDSDGRTGARLLLYFAHGIWFFSVHLGTNGYLLAP